MAEAYQLISAFPESELHLNNRLFYFYLLASLVCASLNKTSEAKEFARRAIDLARITEPQFARHKTVGLVQATEQQVRTLESILEQ